MISSSIMAAGYCQVCYCLPMAGKLAIAQHIYLGLVDVVARQTICIITGLHVQARLLFKLSSA